MQLSPGKQGLVKQVVHCTTLRGTSHTVLKGLEPLDLCSVSPGQPYMLSLDLSDLNLGS